MKILMPKSMFLSKLTKFVKNSLVPKIIAAIIIVGFIWSQSNFVTVSKIIYTNNQVPSSFVGYKIVHISDICNKDTYNLISAVKKERPDIIVISGGFNDLNGNSNTSKNIVNNLSKIAPVYYVYGNGDTGTELSDSTATCMNNMCIELQPSGNNNGIQDESIGIKIEQDYTNVESVSNNVVKLVGFSDFSPTNPSEAESNVADLVGTDPSQLIISLLGKSANIDIVATSDIDMILTGGTYGRNPRAIYEGGVYGVNQLPGAYTKGLYTTQSTIICVSSGIGSLAGRRIMNYPQIQSITLSDGSLKQLSPLEKLLGKYVNDPYEVNDSIQESNENF